MIRKTLAAVVLAAVGATAAPAMAAGHPHRPLEAPAHCAYYDTYTDKACTYWDSGLRHWTRQRPVYWTIKQGDTLWNIAVRGYGVRHGEQWGHGTDQRAGYLWSLIAREAECEMPGSEPTRALTVGDQLFLPDPTSGRPC